MKKIFRTNPGFQSQVQPDLHDSAAVPSSFSCISNNLHLPAYSCASLKVFFAINFLCEVYLLYSLDYREVILMILQVTTLETLTYKICLWKLGFLTEV